VAYRRRFDDRIVVLLGGNRKQQLVRLCAQEQVTVSEMVRTLIDRELERRGPKRR
jgi:hypothetical protein